MQLYRATTSDETGIPVGSCWTDDRDHAEVYTDNQGFGGPVIREIEDDGSVLDIASRYPMDQFRALASAIGLTDDDAQRWMDSGWQYPWEESATVLRALRDTGYHWLRYEDDYPEDCITYTRLQA